MLRISSKKALRSAICLSFLAAAVSWAQETDITQTPNLENAGSKKSLEEQVGAGRGDPSIADSSRFIILRDPFRAIARGRELFQRKFTMAQGQGPRINDGIDLVGSPSGGLSDNDIAAGLADSCAACHGRPKGSAGSGGDVFTRPDSRDAPHLFGLGLVEMLADEITGDLRALRTQALLSAQNLGQPRKVRLLSKGIDYGWLTAHPDGSVDTSQIRGIDPDLRVKPFLAHGGKFSIRVFIVGALKAEMGLEAVDPDLLTTHNGGTVVTPAGMVLDGSLDPIPAPPVSGPQEDGDGDGVVNEIDPAVVDYLEFYLLNYFKPGTYVRDPEAAKAGRRIMSRIGCTRCHIPDLSIDNDARVADVETAYDAKRGIFNSLFATATDLSARENDDPSLPPLRTPAWGGFLVRGVYTDLRRHDLGPNFWERNFDGTLQKEFMTRALWGVATTAPYGHDGRSINLEEVILRHGGEAQASRDAFAVLPSEMKSRMLYFLGTLVLFPPPDTASNLNPGNRLLSDFPQHGHGSIDLSVLFNDPGDPE